MTNPSAVPPTAARGADATPPGAPSRVRAGLLAAAGCLAAAAVGAAFLAGTAEFAAIVVAFVGLAGLAALVLNRQRTGRQKAEHSARASDAASAETEARLCACENRLRWLSEGMKGYAVMTLDADGHILTWEKSAQALYGYTESEVLGRPYSFLCLEDDAAGSKADVEIKRALVTGACEERGWRVRQGGWKFWAEVVYTPMREEGGCLRGLLCLTRDVSAHRQADDALRSSRTLYRNLTETARDIIIAFGKDGTITSLNQAFDKTTGWSRGDWIGRSLLALAHADDHDRMRDLLQFTAGGETAPVAELRIRLAPKAESRRQKAEGCHEELQGSEGQASSPPTAYCLLPSVDFLAVEWMTTPQVHDGEVLGGLALIRDLTDRKKAEASLRATEEKLRQAQKMEAIGRLAGGIAHDFNNLLTVILGNAEMFLMICPDEQLQLYATEITKAADRAAMLTRQLLAFSRKTVMQPRVIEVNARVGNLQKMLERLIGEDVELATRLHADPLHVKADPSQIEQVIMNLVVNARDAMPGGGRLTIATSVVRLDERAASPARSASEGTRNPSFALRAGETPRERAHALLSVSDTGVGMDDNVKSHLFEPFFTTKEQGKGTGLGLAMVYGIVQQSDGHIAVTSAPGAGTTFNIYLPLTEEEPAPERGDRRPARSHAGTETLLLVEDEEGVRALAANALRLNGYKVLECSDGAKALALCESFEDPIHLLVTDVIMPRLGGVDLARHVAPLHPEARVLFMSGYPDRDFVVSPEMAARYIQKPFTAHELTGRVRKLLDSPAEEPVGV